MKKTDSRSSNMPLKVIKVYRKLLSCVTCGYILSIFVSFLFGASFFAEKHGKNGRDSHFSNIAKFITAESLVRRLTSSQDVADAIMTRQRMANENNKGFQFFFFYFSIFFNLFKLFPGETATYSLSSGQLVRENFWKMDGVSREEKGFDKKKKHSIKRNPYRLSR